MEDTNEWMAIYSVGSVAKRAYLGSGLCVGIGSEVRMQLEIQCLPSTASTPQTPGASIGLHE